MSQTFKPYNREQMFLLPPSMREWLPAGDLAYFIIDVVHGWGQPCTWWTRWT